jgi:hypothetical protein
MPKSLNSARTPLRGTYLLKVRHHGELINTTKFVFKGGKLSFLRDNTEWRKGCVFFSDPCLKMYQGRLKVALKNRGDLPVHVSIIKNIRVDGGQWFEDKNDEGHSVWKLERGKNQRVSIDVSDWLLPGQVKTIKQVDQRPSSWRSHLIENIPNDGRTHRLSMSFQDGWRDDGIVLLDVVIKVPKP